MFRQRVGQALVGLLTAAVLVTLLPGIAAAATRPTRFDLYLGMSCVGGVASDGATVNVLWRRPNGKVLVQDSYRATSSGGYWEACAISSGRPPVLKVGDYVEARVGTKSHSLVIPELSLHMNRATNVFRGRAPAGSTVELIHLAGIFADYEIQKSVTANADGVWLYRPRGFDIMGGLYAFVTWTSPANDTITVDGVAPFVRVTLGGSFFRGADYPGTVVRIALTDPGTGEVRATGRATASQGHSFAGHFRNGASNPAPLSAGIRLTAPALATDADWIVPNITATANASADRVSGRCFDAGTSYGWRWVDVLTPGGAVRGYAAGSTDSDGTFEIDFSDPNPVLFYEPANIRSGDVVVIRCLQTTGDWVQTQVVVP